MATVLLIAVHAKSTPCSLLKMLVSCVRSLSAFAISGSPLGHMREPRSHEKKKQCATVQPQCTDALGFPAVKKLNLTRSGVVIR